jgi:hypothetical protein
MDFFFNFMALNEVNSIERSIEFVIIVSGGTEAVGLFESIYLLKINNNQIMLQNAISGVKRRARLCLEQNGEHFQHTYFMF